MNAYFFFIIIHHVIHNKFKTWSSVQTWTVLPSGDGLIPCKTKVSMVTARCKCHVWTPFKCLPYDVVTPLRKVVSIEPRVAILGIWGDTWLTASTWQYVVVTVPLQGLRDVFWKFCHVKSALSTVVSPTW